MALALLAIMSMGCNGSKSAVSGTGSENGHEWMDLGLPSGLKWATSNIGASSPTDFGSYFPWAGVEDAGRMGEYYAYFDQVNWVYTKYTKESNSFRLDSSDDAAHVKWGGKWRMPTKADFEELKSNCRYKWVVENGIEGMRFTSKKNGNSIFLPAAGSTSDPTNVGYWSSDLSEEGAGSDTGGAFCLLFAKGWINTELESARFTCFPIRPVTQ